MEKNFSDKAFYNTILFQTENFSAVPSLGSLIPGWLLIIPKKHYLSFSLIPKDEFIELEGLIETIVNFSRYSFGSEHVLFEHGPAREKSKVGCGVDYAHLHFVPTSEKLMDRIKKTSLELEWNEITSLKELTSLKKSKLDYLYLKDQNNKSFISQNENIPSQLFRRIIADLLGMPEKYDWKRFPFEENIKSTINKFKVIQEV